MKEAIIKTSEPRALRQPLQMKMRQNPGFENRTVTGDQASTT